MPLVDEQIMALWKVGYWRAVDFIVLLAIFWIGMVAFFWWFFGNPSAIQLVCCALLAAALIQIWIVLLIYRAMRFVLELFAEIKLMPQTAAQMVMQYTTKQT